MDLKGLMKLLFSIPPRDKAYFHAKLQSPLLLCFLSVTSIKQLLYCRYGLHYNILLEMMMSVLEGLTKELYFAEGRPVFMQNFRFNVYTVTSFDVGMACIIMY